MKATPQTAGTDCDVTTDPKTAVSFVFSQLVCQVCVYWALARVLNIECQLPVCFAAVTLTRFSVFRNSVFLTLKFCFLTFIFFQAVTFELKRLSGMKPLVETCGESSKPKSGDLLPGSLGKKVLTKAKSAYVTISCTTSQSLTCLRNAVTITHVTSESLT